MDLVLTILAHPDADRLGDRVVWAGHQATFDVNRGTRFRRGALDDRRVSRRGSRLFREDGGVYVVGDERLRVDGAPLAGRCFLSPERLDAGVRLHPSDPVVLLLRLPRMDLGAEHVAAQLRSSYRAHAGVIGRPHDWLTPDQTLDLLARGWDDLDAVDRWVQDYVAQGGDASTRELPGAQPVERAVDRQLLVRIEELVEQDNALTVGALVRHLGTTERSLQRRLASLVGCTPRAHMRNLRLGRAQRLLQQGQFETVGEVAAAVGMSPSTFSRAYRDWAGHSPSRDLA